MSFLGKTTFWASGHAQLCWLCYGIQSDILNVYHCPTDLFLSFCLPPPILCQLQRLSYWQQSQVSLWFPLPGVVIATNVLPHCCYLVCILLYYYYIYIALIEFAITLTIYSMTVHSSAFLWGREHSRNLLYAHTTSLQLLAVEYSRAWYGHGSHWLSNGTSQDGHPLKY